MELIFQYNQYKTTAICCGIEDKNFDGEVKIPQVYNGATVVSISSSAFSKSYISSVRIPKTVKSIGMQAFAYCDNLAQVTFDEDSCLEIIDPLAFSGCNKLTYIKLPDRIRVIERLAFRNCTCEFPNRCLVMTPNFEGCKVITYEPNLPPLAPIEQDDLGNKYRLNEARDGYIVETLYAKDDVIEVPEMFNGLPVVELGNMAFTWNTEAWKAIIPASVKKAGYFPFYACDDMLCAEYGGTILGDVIDRNNKGGVDILKWLLVQPNVQLILGNHEQMLLSNRWVFQEINEDSIDAIDEKNIRLLSLWESNGGGCTMKALSQETQETRQGYS